MQSASETWALDSTPVAAPADGPALTNWIACDPGAPRSAWHPKLQRFFDYWLSIAPPGRLPGRQHFEPMALGAVLPHLWILDVDRSIGAPRFRYRLAGTLEVETLEREVTGHWFDEVHRLDPAHPIYARFAHMLARRVATYRKGVVGLTHDRDHRIVENCMVPLSADGTTVDMIVACSIIFYATGLEVR
jgi:hypothetical protein